MTDEKLFRIVGAGENTPTHIPCRVFVADLQRVFEAGRQVEQEELIALFNTYPNDDHWSGDNDSDFDAGLLEGIRICLNAIHARSTHL